jgi:threonine aldolase
MVVFDLDGGPDESRRFSQALRERDVLVGARGPNSFRAVTHYGIERRDIDRAVSAASEAAAEAFGN